MIKFKTFQPFYKHDRFRGNIKTSADYELNKWLEENPNIEIISWQTCPIGTTSELYITIQYKESTDERA